VHHTRSFAFFESCVFDAVLAANAFDQVDGLGESVLPIGMETFWQADVLANSAQENWFTAEAGVYASIVKKCEEDYKQGIAPTPSMPDTTANQEPVAN